MYLQHILKIHNMDHGLQFSWWILVHDIICAQCTPSNSSDACVFSSLTTKKKTYKTIDVLIG